MTKVKIVPLEVRTSCTLQVWMKVVLQRVYVINVAISVHTLSQMRMHTACVLMAIDRPNACMVLHDMSTAAYVLIKASTTRGIHEAAEV